MRREIPILITLLAGLLILVAFFVPHRPFGGLEQRFQIWYSIVSGFTLVLGLYSLLRHHLLRVRDRRPGWWYSIVLIVGLLATLTIGFVSWVQYNTPTDTRSAFMYLYTHVLIPLQSTMFALLAFFIASAAYRAFRAKTFEATLLLVAAIIVMLGRVPLGQSIWHGIPVLSDWIMDIPQTAAKRGIFIGAYLGTIAMSIRIILGIERTYLA